MTDGDFVGNTDFRYHGAGRLMDYIERKDSYRIENRAGQEMTEKEKEIFRKKSEYYGFERQVIFSPRNDELYSEREMAEATRDTVNQFFDGESVDYCYGVHKDDGHTHVVLTGEIDDLYMDRDDIREMREVEREQFKKHEKCLERQLLRENGLEKDREMDRDRVTRGFEYVE